MYFLLGLSAQPMSDESPFLFSWAVKLLGMFLSNGNIFAAKYVISRTTEVRGLDAVM